MGNSLSGAHARLIFTGRAWRAADFYNFNAWPAPGDVSPLSKEGAHEHAM